MTSRDFVYWLQGYFEISNATALTPTETEVVKRHLNLVFHHEIDPSLDGGDAKVKAERAAVHGGKAAISVINYPDWPRTPMGAPLVVSC